MKNIKVEKYTKTFLNNRGIEDRYSSFDYCFNYFRNFKNKKNIISPQNIEKSCLHLGFYLASRGMYRGASFLLQKNIKIYENLLKEIVKFDKKIWVIDIDKYTDENIEFIIDCYNKIKSVLIRDKERDVVLITKIMLGIFGCIPAYDRYFQKGFKDIIGECGFTVVNKESLEFIYKFYNEEKNKKIIDKYSKEIKTLDFKTGKKTNISYTKAKIIDMIGFTYGLSITPSKKRI